MSITADIQKYNIADGHTEYFIKIMYLDRQWPLRKRFSDFVELDKYLRVRGFEIICQLPEKNWWSRFDPFLLLQRQKELQIYLNSLLAVVGIHDNAAIREFFDVDHNILKHNIAQGSKVLNYKDRLKAIVTKTKRKFLNGNIVPNNRLLLSQRRLLAISQPSSVGKKQSGAAFARAVSHGPGMGSVSSFSNTKSPRFGGSVSGHSASPGGNFSFLKRNDRNDSLESGTSSIMQASGSMGSSAKDNEFALVDAVRKQSFLTYVGNTWEHVAAHIASVVKGVEYPMYYQMSLFYRQNNVLTPSVFTTATNNVNNVSLDKPYLVETSDVVPILSESQDNWFFDLDIALDEVADGILEAKSLNSLSSFSGKEDVVVKGFRIPKTNKSFAAKHSFHALSRSRSGSNSSFGYHRLLTSTGGGSNSFIKESGIAGGESQSFKQLQSSKKPSSSSINAVYNPK